MLVVAVAFGVGALVERSVVAFTVLKLAGAAYLVHLGASVAREWFARSPRRLAAVSRIGGLSMIGLGVTVAVTGRKD